MNADKPESKLNITKFGTFTANFKPLSSFPLPTDQFVTLIATIILGWFLPTLAGRVKTIRQLKHLRECVSQTGKLDRNSMEDKIKQYYVHGKISEEHRQFLRDRISEYYEKDTGSNG